MPKLRLMQISCFRTEERRDEPMLFVNGKKVWSKKNVNDGNAFQLHSIITPISFTDQITVELIEDDPIRDDKLGKKVIKKEEADDYQLRAVDFKGHGAYYYLIYHVLED